MPSLSKKGILQGTLFLLSFGLWSGVHAQATATATTQSLDRVVTFSATASTPVPLATSGSTTTASVEVQPDFFTPLYVTQATGSALVSCQVTATGGLLCIDGKTVRLWQNPEKAPDSTDFVAATDGPRDLFACYNSVLGFDRKQDTCTSVTVDLSGSIWLVGKKSSTYSLVKITRTATPKSNPTGCSVGSWLGADSSDPSADKAYFCAQVYASGRPYFQDLTDVEGDRYTGFALGVGLPGVQTRNTLVYFSKPDAPPSSATVISGSKTILGLSGNEQIQSTALVKVDSGDYFFAYTTSLGKVRLIKAEANTATPSVMAFDALANRPTPVSGCTASKSDQFGVRASPTTATVYVTDRSACLMWVLPVASSAGAGSAPYIPQSPMPQYVALTSPTTSSGGGLVALNPESPTVSPGIQVDLSQCDALGCNLLNSYTSDGKPTAELKYVGLQPGSQSYMTLFQIKGIPDCRYLSPTDSRCVGTNSVRNCPPNSPTACPATANPAEQYLNVAPLLPSEVKTVLTATYGFVPDMFISPQYRGHSGSNSSYTFDAMLGIPEPGVNFKDVFSFEIEVAALTSNSYGCTYSSPGDTLSTLLSWDVVTTVSERYDTFSNNVSYPGHVDQIVNTGCGGTATAGGRWSLWSYNLETNPNTISYVNGQKYLNTNDDAVFAKLLDRLYNDLGNTQSTYVCPATGTQLAPNCSTLQADWANGRDKLTKCIGASTQPKQSSGAQNCQAFSSQLTGYASDLSTVPANTADTANRIGELKARIQTVTLIFNDRFTPSIPLNGFCDDPTNSACNMTPLP